MEHCGHVEVHPLEPLAVRAQHRDDPEAPALDLARVLALEHEALAAAALAAADDAVDLVEAPHRNGAAQTDTGAARFLARVSPSPVADCAHREEHSETDGEHERRT